MISRTMLESKWVSFCKKQGWSAADSDGIIALRHDLLDGYTVRAYQDMGIDGRLVWAFFVKHDEDIDPIRPYPMGLIT